MKPNEILDELNRLFPDAQCELNHRNPFELLVAVVLSAQTTDASVNKVTPGLFERYPDAEALSKADPKEVEPYIHAIGLYRNKAKSIVGLSKGLVDLYDGVVPQTMEELTKLPGVGRKSANVVMGVCFDIPSIPVDTHVERVSKRLRLAKEDATVLEVEKSLAKKLPKYRWNKAHHQLIFFGRYLCKAQHPLCEKCPFTDFCREYKKRTRN